MEQKTNINPTILQEMLASAVNAVEKGQSQFFTPPDFGKWCAQSLPKIRPTITDLTCGNGQFLQASAQPKVNEKGRNSDGTTDLLGSDIDPSRTAPGAWVNRIQYDLTLLYPLLAEVAWNADCFVLNPPWRLFWHRDRLEHLARSEVSAVAEAWKAVEEIAPRGTIDSTIATLMIALDRCTRAGEGCLIANNNTLDRLLFNPGAPFKALAAHIWARVVIPGNPMTDAGDATREFKTGVIYFARDHLCGPTHYDYPTIPDRTQRMGRELLGEYDSHKTTVERWNAVRDKVSELRGNAGRNTWNIWIDDRQYIHTHLSTFEECSVKTNKAEAARLFNLNGKTPMELVLQRAQRDELLHVVEKAKWKVDPALIKAVHLAVKEYHAARAPLYPLPEIQRLGYLDEQDVIECKQDLVIHRDIKPFQVETENETIFIRTKSQNETFDSLDEANRRCAELNAGLPPAQELIFRAGQKYSIRTQTVEVERKVEKPDPFTGRKEDVEFKGQELAIFLADCIREPENKEQEFNEYSFMDASLRQGKTTIKEARQQTRRKSSWAPEADAIPIDFTLQELAAHFTIPEVPDVATNNPEQFKANLAKLDEIERLCAA